MRQKQKREILECINSLYQAHGEIRGAGEKGRTVSVQSMLSECQEFAIQIGNVIEAMEGSGTETVRLLEEYCECIFSVYQEAGSIADRNRLCKKLEKSLLKVENSVKNDIVARREIVFFPYKASMWDSLESVYLEAEKSRDCDVYCVPIPYFERNPDGSFGSMHYEGAQYPSGIRTMDWEFYSLEEREPDVIFIHNSYDDHNFVTSVHPRFYTANLKKYTKNLIYIPYFVVNENLSADNEKDIEEIRHFCFTPGIINADHVIVQSEPIRRIYAKVYADAVRRQGIEADEQAVNDKFWGLGSPKFDKVRNKDNGNGVPQEWNRILENRGNKKIIFWNIGISEILCNTELVIKKLKYIFHYFYNRKDKFILLLRPHPLLVNTIRSMCPRLLNDYRAFVDDFRNGGWGIYDNTPDVNRAVGLCDIYLGGGSSVIQLFRSVRKPSFRISYAVNSFNNEYGINADVCRVGRDIWFLPIWSNQLYCFHTDTGETEFVRGLWQYPSKGRHLFCSILFYEGKLYLIPFDAETMVIFDLSERNFVKYVKFPKTRFKQGIMIGGQLYLIPGSGRNIWQFDLEKEEVTESYMIHIDGLADEEEFCETKPAVYGKQIFIPVSRSNCILIFDTVTKAMRTVSMQPYMDDVGAVCVWQNAVWISDQKGDLYCFDPDLTFRTVCRTGVMLSDCGVWGKCEYCCADRDNIYIAAGEYYVKMPITDMTVAGECMEIMHREKSYCDVGCAYMAVTGGERLEICCLSTGVWEVFELHDFRCCRQEAAEKHLAEMNFEIFETDHVNLEEMMENLKTGDTAYGDKNVNRFAEKIWKRVYEEL